MSTVTHEILLRTLREGQWCGYEAAAELIRKGADPNAIAEPRESPFGGLPLLSWAMRTDDLLDEDQVYEVVCVLLDGGADPNKPDKDGSRPLHHCLLGYGSPRIAERLVQSGANPNARDNSGRSALDYAAAKPALSDFSTVLQQ